MTENKPCELCGSLEQATYLAKIYTHAGQDYDLAQCSSCGLVFVRPLPGLAEIREFYSQKYFESDFSCGMYEKSYLETESSRVQEYRELLGLIQNFKAGGKLLEIGCAAGSFLYYASRAGFEVEGVDISGWAAEQARLQFGLKVHRGRLTELALPPESYEVIVLSDLLEHEPEPTRFLLEVRRLLKKNGIAVIKVPTYVNSFYYRLARRLPWSWTLGKLDARLLQALKVWDQGPKFPPYHLYEYSPATLSALLENCGFEIIGRKSSLLIPEFLETSRPGLVSSFIRIGFHGLRFLVRRLNLRGGHTIVFAVKGKAA